MTKRIATDSIKGYFYQFYYIENEITEFRDSIYYNILKRTPSYINHEKNI